MDNDISMQIDGMEELKETMKRLAKKYPDDAGNLLVKNARKLRKDVVKNVKKNTTPTGKKERYPMHKISSYEISQVKGYGAGQFIQIKAKPPQFHLVENGHNLVIGGKVVGFVRGKHIMENSIKKANVEFPETVSAMVDELLKKEGLI